MKIVRCDYCRKETEPDVYGSAPKGWLHITTSGQYTASPDYCSTTCAVEALTKSQAPAPPATATKPDPTEPADSLAMM